MKRLDRSLLGAGVLIPWLTGCGLGTAGVVAASDGGSSSSNAAAVGGIVSFLALEDSQGAEARDPVQAPDGEDQAATTSALVDLGEPTVPFLIEGLKGEQARVQRGIASASALMERRRLHVTTTHFLETLPGIPRLAAFPLARLELI